MAMSLGTNAVVVTRVHCIVNSKDPVHAQLDIHWLHAGNGVLNDVYCSVLIFKNNSNNVH